MVQPHKSVAVAKLTFHHAPEEPVILVLGFNWKLYVAVLQTFQLSRFDRETPV